MTSNEVDNAFNAAAIRGTAQAVFDDLIKIENAPELYKDRWIWELLQNARDAAKGSEIEVRLELDQGVFRFSHNGSPFTIPEAVQLITHGSTKRQETGKIGKFGTGFITTHFVSKIVDVSGVLDTDHVFGFTLDRIADSAETLERKMIMAKDQLKTQTHAAGDAERFKTHFSFRLDNQGAALVRSSIVNLRRVMPFILAFNPEFGRAVVIIDREEEAWTRESSNEVSPGRTITRISSSGTSDRTLHSSSVLHCQSDDCTIACLIEPGGDEVEYKPMVDVPKLFIAFPLAQTEDFPIPFVVNSTHLEPRDDRDGIWLAVDTSQSEGNRRILTEAGELYVNLLEFSIERGWKGLQNLTRLAPIPERDWAKGEWTRDFVLGSIAEPIRKSRSVLVVAGDSARPVECLIPYSSETRVTDVIWRFLSLIYPDKVPSHDVLANWQDYLKVVGELEGQPPNSYREAQSLSSLASHIAGLGSLSGLGVRVHMEGTELTELINEFLLTVHDFEEALLTTNSVLPDQEGVFRSRSEVYRDNGIDSTLKDISDDLDTHERRRLLDLGVAPQIQKLLNPRTESDVIENLLRIVKEKMKLVGNENYRMGNARLLGWIVSHLASSDSNDYSQMEGYPILTESEKEPEVTADLSSSSPLLPPIGVWADADQGYFDLFPSDKIINRIYERFLDGANWSYLSKANFVYHDLLVPKSFSLDKDDLRLILSEDQPIDDEKTHRVTTEMSTVAFIESDRGVLERVYDSAERGVLFLDFMLKNLLTKDQNWDESKAVQCECGTAHTVYPSHWMLQVKKRVWVTVAPKDRRKVGAATLSRLFEGRDDLQQKLTEDTATRFLRRLGVSVTELMRNIAGPEQSDKDELDKALVKVLLASGKDVKTLNNVADVLSDPSLAQKVDELRTRKMMVKRNQSVGAMVEELLREVFATQGITLVRTGRGSDFEYDYENDYTGAEGQIVLSANRFLFEVKSTTQDVVKMTPAQAREAVKTGEFFILAVVGHNGSPDLEEVKSSVRFVQNIGAKLSDSVTSLDRIKSAELEASVANQTGVELTIDRGTIRFNIYGSVWRAGVGLNELLAILHSTLPK